MLSKKKNGVDWQEASHRWAKHNSLAGAQFDIAQASEGLGNTFTSVQALQRDFALENLDTLFEWSSEKKKKKQKNLNVEIPILVKTNSTPHDNVIHTAGRLSHEGPVWLEVHSQAGLFAKMV